MASTHRFGQATAEEIQHKRLKVNSDNTIQFNQKAAKVLNDYLKEKQQDSNFEEIDEVRLNEIPWFYLYSSA